jgi:NADPH-dependent 2,4-dienoyl-CoA reductase/sulfur reductase-like enzyme
MIIQPAAIPQGVYVENAATIKKAIDSAVPVIVVGRIKDVRMAEQIIREGKADLVAMGRALLGDPDLPRKVAEGKFAEIRKCIGCNQGCIDRLFQDVDIACMINPLTGHETDFDMDAPVDKKKVLVVGGGPAGLEATWMTDLRGHETILYEKEAELGGQLRIAAKPPYKEEINDLLAHLIHKVENSGAVIVKGMEIDLTKVRGNHPDFVILATGSEATMPNIPGIYQRNVVSSHNVLKGTVSVGQKVVVIGGGMVGCETAEYLADRGKHVTIVEMLDDVGLDIGALTRGLLINRLVEKKVSILTKSRVSEIVGERVKIEKEDGNVVISGVDSVVVAVGSRSMNRLAEEIRGEGIPVYVIGDALKPRKIYEAIHEGFRVGYEVGLVDLKNRVPVLR